MIDMATQPKRVLVCYDGSGAAEKALDAAASLIGYGSTLAVASVAPLGADTTQATLNGARERLLERHVPATHLPATRPTSSSTPSRCLVPTCSSWAVGLRTATWSSVSAR
jgi:hypothetical protein